MLDAGDARRVADEFGLGDRAVLAGPVAAAEQGAVWRLDTDAGIFAVKDVFGPSGEAQARASAQFQGAADAAGVLTPRVVRTVGRAYELVRSTRSCRCPAASRAGTLSGALSIEWRHIRRHSTGKAPLDSEFAPS